MLIEIKGINFFNKGAELMFLAVKEKVLQEFPSARLCVSIRSGSQKQLRTNNLLGLLYFNSPKYTNIDRLVVNISKFTPSRILNLLSLARVRDIDVVFDASGFAYSDQWGEHNLKLSFWYFKQIKRFGGKVIILPQAFGPFEIESNKKFAEQMFAECDLVYARDKTSLQHVSPFIGKTILRLSPDFTNLISVNATSKERLRGVCIIPNFRMIDMGSGEQYYGFLELIIKHLVSNQIDYFFLVHETAVDSIVLDKLQQKLNMNFPAIYETDALKIKTIIGKSNFVIGSRFHGLINALSQNVPVLMTGWSHKYKELALDYGVEKFLIENFSDEKEILERIDTLIESRGEVSKSIEFYSNTIKGKVMDMWDNIFSYLKE